MSNINEFFEHHGVRGQKWGFRNAPTKKEAKARTSRKKVSDNRRHLSDEDLKKYIDRISGEKKLKSLVEEDLSPGKAATKRILSESGQKVARTVIAGAALYGIKAVMEKKFNIKEAAGYVAPKPKLK